MSDKQIVAPIKKITKLEADKIIAQTDSDSESKLELMKLGKFYYDITNANESDLIKFISEHNRRAINKPEFGACRL